MGKYRVLLVHKFFHVTGGAEVFFFETARVLRERGHEVAFFSTSDVRNKPSDYSHYFVNAPNYKSGGLINKIAAIGKIVYSFEAKTKLKQLIEDFNPDIVHVFAMFTHLSPSILEACHEAGVPVVMSCNDYKHICPNYKLYHHGRICEDCRGGKFYMAIKNRCCQDSVLFSVASCIESYAHYYMNILQRNIRFFLFAGDFMAKETEKFWGVNTFRQRKLANPYNSAKYPLFQAYNDYILFVGRFVEEKGGASLMRAMTRCPEVKLIMVGDGPQSEFLHSMAREFALANVDFVGPKWGHDLDLLLQKARFVVVPSVWHENFPYVIFHAFSFGKPVVGADRGGITELVAHGQRGLIYPALDEHSLAQSINMLWNDPERCVQMGRCAKEFIDNEYTDEKFYFNLTNIYEEAMQ